MKSVNFGTLSNGMRYYGQRSPSSAVSGIGVKCGSIHDPPGKNGFAHLAEHVMCRRSGSRSSREVDLFLEKFMGGPEGDINIRVTRSSTFFGHEDLLRSSHMFQSFDLFARILKDRILELDDMQIEKAAVHQEYYLNGVDLMPALVDDLMHQAMYSRNPARNRIDCDPEQLKNGSLLQLKSFIKRQYVPNNMFVVMLGPSLKEVAELTKRNFEDWDNSPQPTLLYNGSDNFPRLTQIKSKIIERPGIHQYHCAIGFPTEAYVSEDAEALDILSRIWAFRMRWALREENKDFDKGVYRALSYTPRTFCHGMIYLWFATTNREFEEQSEEAVLGECENLKKTLVAQEELDAIASNLIYNFRSAFQNSPSILSEMIIESVCNGDENLIRLHSLGDRLKKVSRRKILAVANKYFSSNYVRVLIKPA